MKLLLYFADNLVSPCLWVGTALGNVFVVVLNLPVREQRESQPVLTITTGNPVILGRSSLTLETHGFYCDPVCSFMLEIHHEKGYRITEALKPTNRDASDRQVHACNDACMSVRILC